MDLNNIIKSPIGAGVLATAAALAYFFLMNKTVIISLLVGLLAYLWVKNSSNADKTADDQPKSDPDLKVIGVSAPVPAKETQTSSGISHHIQTAKGVVNSLVSIGKALVGQ